MEEASVIKHLERIEELLRVLVKSNLAQTMAREFEDTRLEKLYELTGELKQKDIAKKLHIWTKTISDSWRRWERLGLLVKDDKGYRKVV